MQLKNQRRRRTRAEWAEHVSAWEKCGTTQAEYCLQHNLDSSLFSSWKSKFRDEAMPMVEISPRFIESNDEYSGKIEIVLDGIRILIRESIDPIKLRNIVASLAGV
jgi:hypothetical protein